jgi:LmbE family N-acetylglucosaminyl deacetylase
MRPLLAIAPHLDDAVLSIGAAIAERSLQGAHTEVVTVFAGANPHPASDYAGKVHSACGLGDDAVGQRRAEDVAAVTTLGGCPTHLSFLDAIYRSDANGTWRYPSGQDLFTADPAEEAILGRQVYEVLAAKYDGSGEAQLATCAGLGGHIDHLVTRDAVLRLGHQLGLPVLLWEDLPYGVAREYAGPVPLFYDFPGAAAWALKWRAIECYRSQLAKVWPQRQDWRSELFRHALVRGRGSGPVEAMWRAGAGESAGPGRDHTPADPVPGGREK